MSDPAILTSTVQKAREWLHDVAGELGHGDAGTAYAALRATLHVLRDHLNVDEAAQLAAQLPTLIRGIYYEGWDPPTAVTRPRSREAFLAAVAHQLKDHPELLPPEKPVGAVFAVLARRISGGEMDQVIGRLPKGIRELWAVLTF